MGSPSFPRGPKGLFAPDSLASAIFHLDDLRRVLSPVSCPVRKSRALLSLALAAEALEKRFLGHRQPPWDGLSAGLFEQLRALVASTGIAPPQPKVPVSRHVNTEARADAAGRLSIASYEERGLASSLARVLAIGHRRARAHAWLGLVRSAARLERDSDVAVLLEAAPSELSRERGILAFAEALVPRGERRRARVLLGRVSSPLLFTSVALLRARLDLEGGLTDRARRRVEALPGALHVPSRALFASAAPQHPDEPEPLALACAREAMLLRYRLGCISPETRAGRDAVTAWIEDPRVCLDLFPTWEGDRSPEHILCSAPRMAHQRLRDRYRSAFVCAHAGAIAAEAGSRTGTLDEALSSGLPGEEEPCSTTGDPCAPSVRLAAFGLASGALAPLDLPRPDLGGATSPARTFFDEGLSMTPRRERKRTVLLEACKSSLAALLAGAPQPPFASAMVASRARLLLRLQGDRAASLLSSALSRTPFRGPVPRLPLIRVLAELSPRRALDLFASMPPLLADDIVPMREMARCLEERHLLLPDTGGLLQRAHDALFLRFTVRAVQWLAGFIRAFTAAFGAPPARPAMERLLGLDRATLPLDPRDVVARWTAERDALTALPLRRFVRSLDAATTMALVSTHPLSFSRRRLRWNERDWHDLVGRLRARIRGVARAPMRRLAAVLGDRAGVLERLARGAPPTPGLEQDIPLAGGASFSLRYLDKRRDAIAFFRFADCVTCCYTSDSALYVDLRDDQDTQMMILSLYRDPLSFCFQVRRSSGPVIEPFGFVFGSFGVTEGRPAVLLNGVYLRRQSPKLRHSVVNAIEEHLCGPIGILDVAIGCRFGGKGPIPPGYEATPRHVHRLRALVGLEGLASYIYDDVSSVVNSDYETDSDVYWRTSR